MPEAVQGLNMACAIASMGGSSSCWTGYPEGERSRLEHGPYGLFSMKPGVSSQSLLW